MTRVIVASGSWLAAFGALVLVMATRSWPATQAAIAGALAGTAAAVVVGRSRSRIINVAVATVVGLCALPVGHSLGWLRVRAGEVTVASSLAVVTLGAGALLVLWAAVTTVRAAAQPGYLVVGPLVVVALAVVGRQIVFPISYAVGYVDGARHELTAAASPGLPAIDVRFTASDGVRLAGWYAPSRNGAAVIVAPGGYTNRTASMRHAQLLVRHGYGVLVYDARGQGASDGHAMEFGWYGERDLRGAVDFVTAQSDVDRGRVGVLGLSLGGESALGAAGVDERICAVVADGASYRVPGDWTPQSRAGLLARWREQVLFAVVDLLATGERPPTLAESTRDIAPRDVLLIATGHGYELEAAETMSEVAPDSVEIWSVPDADHLEAITKYPEEYEERVVPFFDRHLSTTAARTGCAES